MKRKKMGLAMFTAASIFFGSWVKPSASIRGSFQFNPPKPWRKVAMLGVEGAWVIGENPANPSLTVTFRSGNEVYDEKALDENQFISFLEETRAIPYRIFGIRDWQVSAHHLTHYKGGFYIELKGSYLSPANKRVRFIERDHFVGSSSFAVAYSEDQVREKAKAALDDEEVNLLLNGFHPSVASASSAPEGR